MFTARTITNYDHGEDGCGGSRSRPWSRARRRSAAAVVVKAAAVAINPRRLRHRGVGYGQNPGHIVIYAPGEFSLAALL